jgi:hypothetical protein
MIIAIDVGFAETKFAYENNGNITYGSIPTAIALPADTGIIGIGAEQAVVKFKDGREFVAGDDAFCSPHQLENTSIDWLIRMSPALVIATIRKIGCSFEQVSRVAVGLPIQFWQKEAQRVQKTLTNIELDSATFTAEVKVFAQGAGAFYCYCQTKNPPASENGLLIDLGGNTLQVLGFEKLKIRAALSKQYNHLGMLEPAKRLVNSIAADHSISISTAKAMVILRSGTFSIPGDYLSLSEQLITNHMQLLVERLEADWGERIMQAHRLVLAGGGAYHLIHHLPEAWKRKAIQLTDAKYANVIGYFMQLRSLL